MDNFPSNRLQVSLLRSESRQSRMEHGSKQLHGTRLGKVSALRKGNANHFHNVARRSVVLASRLDPRS